MGLFDIFKVQHPETAVEAYNKLANNELCRFYLKKIPKYCAVDKILWIEAAVIDNGVVKSFRITYYDEHSFENTDIRISFRRYGHHGMPLERFSEFLKYLSIALHKSRFIYIDRNYDEYPAGSVYNRKYAKKMYLI